jgi:hypothetical protein
MITATRSPEAGARRLREAAESLESVRDTLVSLEPGNVLTDSACARISLGMIQAAQSMLDGRDALAKMAPLRSRTLTPLGNDARRTWGSSVLMPADLNDVTREPEKFLRLRDASVRQLNAAIEHAADAAAMLERAPAKPSPLPSAIRSELLHDAASSLRDANAEISSLEEMVASLTPQQGPEWRRWHEFDTRSQHAAQLLIKAREGMAASNVVSDYMRDGLGLDARRLAALGDFEQRWLRMYRADYPKSFPHEQSHLLKMLRLARIQTNHAADQIAREVAGI